MKSPKSCLSIILLISLCTCQFEIPINFERNDEILNRNQIYLERFSRYNSLNEFKDDPENSDLIFNPEVNLEELYEEYQNTNRKIEFLSQNIENSNDTQFSTIPQKSTFLTVDVSIGIILKNKFKLAIDSSHSGTWVPSNTCDNCENKNKFSPDFLKPTGIKITVFNYHETYLQGDVYEDDMTLNNLKASDQPFLATNHVGFYKNYATMNFDGILALGHQEMGFNQKYNSFLTTLKTQKKIDYRSYSIDLKLNKLIFAQKNMQKYFSDKIYYFKVDSKFRGWKFDTNIVINYGPNSLKLTTGIVDSAIGYIFLSPTNVAKISNYLNFQSTTCDVSNSGNIQIWLNNFKIDLPKYDYIYKNGNICQLKFLANTNVNDFTIVLGIPALKNRFTIFDAEANQVGFSSSNYRFGSIGITIVFGLLFYLLKF